MNVEVILFGKLRKLATRQRVVSIADGSRLIDLIDWLANEYGADFREEINRSNIMINGHYHDLQDGMETPLKEGDTVAILPILVGG